MGCKSTLWIVGTTIETTISSVSEHKISTTLRTYSRCQFVINFFFYSFDIMNMLLVIYQLSNIVFDKAFNYFFHICIRKINVSILLYCVQQFIVINNMIFLLHIFEDSSTCKNDNRNDFYV